MLVELDGLSGTGQGGTGQGGTGVSPVRSYTWGLDLAGQVGARSSALPPDAGHGGPALRDANGNVGQLVAWAEDYGGTTEYAWDTQQSPNVRLVAAYEYDPYGNITAQSGAYAGNNPFRFSTKYYDTQTGLGYWGYRYYSPGLGRWISRDPIGERGGTNVYAYVANAPVCFGDPLGLDRKDYRYGVAKHVCGFWVVCPTRANLKGTEYEHKFDLADIDSSDVLGFEVRFFPWRTSEIADVKNIRDCCCGCGDDMLPGDIRVLQVIDSPGSRVHLDPAKPRKVVPPDRPWGYVEAGGMEGSAPLSHKDFPKSMVDRRGNEHKIEVCAVCRYLGRDTVLGCLYFRYFDGAIGKGGEDRKVVGLEQHKLKFHGRECFGKASEPPSGLYGRGIDWWKNQEPQK